MLARKVDLNAPNDDGATPLYVASARGHIDVARALLERRQNNLTAE